MPSKGIETALVGTLIGLGIAAVAIYLLWPTINSKLVASVNAELTAQNVAGQQASQALAGLKQLL